MRVWVDDYFFFLSGSGRVLGWLQVEFLSVGQVGLVQSGLRRLLYMDSAVARKLNYGLWNSGVR